MRSLASLTAVAWLAMPILANAQPQEFMGVAAVAEAPGPSPELVEMTIQLRSVVSERTTGVLEAAQLRERMAGRPSNASLAELDRAYSGALATYQNGDYEGAIRTLRAVIEDLEKLPDGPETFSQWTRAMLRLARAQGTVGQKGEARATLERLVRAAPAVKVDPTQYPPSFERQVDEMKTHLKALPQRRLAVTTSLKGARVYVDGRDVGPAPVTAPLAPGRYRVSAAHGQLRVPGITVDLTEVDQSVALDFNLAESLRPALGPGFALPEADRARRLVTAAAALGLDKLLATSFAQDGDVTFLVGTLYDVRRGMIQREGRVRLAAGKSLPPGGATALASFLITGRPSNLVAPGASERQAVAMAPRPAATAQRPAPDLSPRPVAEKDIPSVEVKTEVRTGDRPRLLGWSSLGCGALALGLGTVAVIQGVNASSHYGDAQSMLTSGGRLPAGSDVGRYNQLVADGDSAKSTALITGAGAGVSLVTAGVLGYVSYRQSGEIGPIRF